MASDITDKPRLLRFKADGKTDLLLPTGFTATERMSGLFQVDVDLLVAPDKVGQVQGDQLLGKRMTLRVSHGGDYAQGPYRFFDGMCCRFASVGKDDRFSYFRAQLVPWAWLLTKRTDVRVYQDKNVPDIVEAVLKELQQDFAEFQFEIRANRGQYKKIDYCAQFRETHFNFVSRLLEQDGLYYYFEHTEGGHKLIIDDSLTAGNDVPNQAEVPFSPASGPEHMQDDSLVSWREERIIHSGKFAARDYHSQLAQNKIDFSGISPKTSVAKNDKLEVFEWPSGSGLRYNQTDQRLDEVNAVGTTLTNLHAQAAEATHHTFSGSSCCRGFTPGYRFGLKHESGKKYLLTEVQHFARQNASYVVEEVIPTPYTNTFSAIPADVQFRPQRVTPKPVVDGMQSAKVVGKDGDEIYIDKYGRVRVQFFWDRKGENNEKSTCWVRVAQISAGKRWGASFWPRIGQEVVVAFLEGDPDQPVIVGSLYNNQQMPPYLGDGLDDKHKNDPNVSGIKTNSTKGGDGFNELRFDDTKDKEQVFIHAEKDMDVRVKNESRELILNHSHVIVGSDDQKADRREQVFQDHHMTIERHEIERVKENRQLLVGGNMDIVTKQNLKELVEGDQHVHVKMGRNEKVDLNQSLTVGLNQDEKVGMNHALEAGMCMHFKAGMTLVLEAGLQLTLKVGSNFIDINPAGVFIQGVLVMINSGGAAGSGAGASPTEPQDAEEADPTKPDEADNSVTGLKSAS
jgi:type VI secretion system secreted protein VgrG